MLKTPYDRQRESLASCLKLIQRYSLAIEANAKNENDPSVYLKIASELNAVTSLAARCIKLSLPAKAAKKE